MQLNVPISAGELLDKVSILRIKSERIADAEKLRNVHHELRSLQHVVENIAVSENQLGEWLHQLVEINSRLWEIEDDLRGCEAVGDFGPNFIELARAVYRTNDLRARVKREINEATGSELVEEKSYVDPDSEPPGAA